jgi:outer membrane receptor protein involved in Fe transport
VKGFNGNVNLAYTQGVHARSSDAINLNFRNNKFNLFTSAGYNLTGGFENLNINRYYKNPDLTTKSNFYQNTSSKRIGHIGSFKMGLDFYANEKTTLGLTFNGLVRTNSDKRTNESRIEDAAAALLGRVVADNLDELQFLNGGTNFNLRHDIDTLGKKITLDLDYVRYATQSNQSFINNIYLGNGQLDTSDILIGNLPTGINIYAIKSDYSMPFKKDGSFEAGIKTSFTQTDNKANYSNTINGVNIPNYDRSNHYKYNEVINAAYLNLNKTFKKLQLQAGLRVENTISMGNQLGNIVKPGSKYDTTYTELFPTFYAAYTVDSAGSHQLGFSYGRRIDRPFFQDLNPFLNPLDKFTIYSGNPYLKPSFSNAFELSYTYKTLFTWTLSYNLSQKEIAETVKIVDGIFYSQPANLGQSQFVSLNVNSSIPITKWWTSNIYSEVTHSSFQSPLYGQNLNSSGTLWYIQASNLFQFGKGWSGELTGIYNTDGTYAQFRVLGFGVVNLGVQKKIMKNKGTLKLAINDLFYTRFNAGIINNLNLSEGNYKGLHDTRNVTLSFAYNFGKQYENRGKHTVLGSDEERKRVKG